VANNGYGGVQAQEASSSTTPLVYEPVDDASWAIHSTKLSSTVLGGHVQRLYDDFIEKCEVAIAEKRNNPTGTFCADNEQHRLRMNREQPSSVYNYTKLGFTKIKAPPELFTLILDFYKKNKHKAAIEWKQINTYHNMWEAPPTIVHVNRKVDLQSKIWASARPLMEEWTGQELAPVSLYGIRLYHNGSILAPHVDRMPLVTSAISK
jgi:prolyl 4-hydroxylase